PHVAGVTHECGNDEPWWRYVGGSALMYADVDFFFQAEDGIRDFHVTGVQTCALPISHAVITNEIFANDECLRQPVRTRLFGVAKIGRASCRERVEILGADGS